MIDVTTEKKIKNKETLVGEERGGKEKKTKRKEKEAW